MANVLIVDDEESIRFTFGEFLEEDNHRVFTATDAPQALAIVDEQPIDIVVSDIVLPKMSGTELLERLRAISKNIQVIMITGEPTVETASQSVRYGAFDYIAKPVSGKTIRRAVASAAKIKILNEEKTRLEEENQKYQKHLEKLVADRTTELEFINKMLRREIDQRKEVEHELKANLGRLGQAFESIVQAMAIAIEKRDPYTAGHQVRVADLARAIGEQLNMDGDQLNGLYMAALLHDVGKISIPAEILAKPTKLSQEEFAIIKQHSQTGFDILSTVNFPWPIARIAHQHHERLNGSGYPLGLTGDLILKEARIIGVADVLEAMTNHRPYRPALGLEAAMAELNKHRGTMYDQEIVDACREVIKNHSLTI